MKKGDRIEVKVLNEDTRKMETKEGIFIEHFEGVGVRVLIDRVERMKTECNVIGLSK